MGQLEWQRHLKRLSHEGGPRKKSTDTVVGPDGHLLWASAPPSGCRLQKATRLKWGKREDSKPFFVPVWVSGCRLVVVFGAALFVVLGVSVFPFVCALLRRLFWKAFLLFVSLVHSGKGAVAVSPARTLCVVGYTQGTETSDPRSFLQVPPAGKLDCGDAATNHFGVYSGHWPEFTGVVRSHIPPFLASELSMVLRRQLNSFFKSIRAIDAVGP